MKNAWLTIDDAPSADFMPKMQFLAKLDIPVLFFCTGEAIQARAADVVAAIRQGFVVGNHSWSHRPFSSLGLEDCRREITETDALIEQCYRDAGIERPGKYFRFPYLDTGGDKRQALQELLAALGFRQPRFDGIDRQYFRDATLLEDRDLRCTFDQAEYYLGKDDAPWGLSNAEAILARIDENVPHEGRSLSCLDTADIILLHDHEHTSDLFYRIVGRYVEKAIRFREFRHD